MTIPIERPETTLFLIMSVDGKISSGDSDEVDVDKDWKNLQGVSEGLGQYYAIEQTTDLHSLISGRVLAKLGANDHAYDPIKSDVSFIVIDSRPHLRESGIRYYAKLAKSLIIVTSNQLHPAFRLSSSLENLEVLLHESFSLSSVLHELKGKFGIEKLTIQTGGTLNAALLREGLIDHVSLVVAPLLVGGSTTSTLIDGEAVHGPGDLGLLKPLTLVSCEVLRDSYLHLRYDVIFDTSCHRGDSLP